ncbi:LegC family aminotransferase [Legionella hackeliae]|uniref:Putative aminotransferase n=1 Tax=Legionella hackeliae TaxID=449 RepID=A0A0A8UNA7_LEGHA|nr:LegC family aminotransferase [Legionella hackeliae]KTD08790.1 cell wall biosynthesis regulatory pyridoxal phosphate-dependent protein [Legionella hackeliae]CEK10218.1 putative aminotransferase [Legionella hackeliae]STX46947.1 pyridoxal phosphate-dependent enzyme [Legionella hackeliae]
MFKPIIEFIREQYQTNEVIPLHAPIFAANERQYLLDAIDSTFVSSIGAYVDQFELQMSEYTKSPNAVVTVNGTSALHIALKLAGVDFSDYVITQPLTFVATCNAILYCQAEPLFIDVDKETLGLSPDALNTWLEEHAFIDDSGLCRYKQNQRIIRACVPMHTFGHPVKIQELLKICQKWNLSLVEDAAESLGSFYKGQHTGTFGVAGILSFNGNKIITSGGGGMILTNKILGKHAKHLTTTAKQPHPFEYYHDELGYNYRMPNINAALGCAQLEQLEHFIEDKRALAQEYENLFANSAWKFVKEPTDCRSNYWLNAVICENELQRNALLTETNQAGVMTRPIWKLMNHLPMYSQMLMGSLENAEWLAERVVNLPSSVRFNRRKQHA